MYAFVIALMLALLSAPIQAADTSPDAAEVLFWQSAERQGTPQAYRAYLTRYPAGFFAPLAASALTNPAAPVSVPAPVTTAMPTAATTGTLKSFNEEAPSGAVTFKLGDEFVGPQAVTVGWLGARKQLVLPAGRWVALAADDEAVNLPSIYANFPPVPRQRITTVVFGKFVGARLASALSFRFSSQKAPSTTNWSSVEGCERAGEMRLRSAPTTASGYRSECSAQAFIVKPWPDDMPVASQVMAALAKLGGNAFGPALASTLSFSERERGYYSVSRLDWPALWLADDAQSARDWRVDAMEPTREVFASRQWAWFKTYRNAASSGYANDIGDASAITAEFEPKLPIAQR